MSICVAFAAPPAGTRHPLPDGTASPTIAAGGDSTISSGAFYGGSLSDSVQVDAERRGSSGDVLVPLPNRDERKKYGKSMHNAERLRITTTCYKLVPPSCSAFVVAHKPHNDVE